MVDKLTVQAAGKTSMAKRTAKEYIKALEKSGGLVAPAARRLGVTRAAVYAMAKSHPTVKAAMDDARADMLDLCESNFFQAVGKGSLASEQPELIDLGRVLWGLEQLTGEHYTVTDLLEYDAADVEAPPASPLLVYFIPGMKRRTRCLTTSRIFWSASKSMKPERRPRDHFVRL